MGFDRLVQTQGVLQHICVNVCVFWLMKGTRGQITPSVLLTGRETGLSRAAPPSPFTNGCPSPPPPPLLSWCFPLFILHPPLDGGDGSVVKQSLGWYVWLINFRSYSLIHLLQLNDHLLYNNDQTSIYFKIIELSFGVVVADSHSQHILPEQVRCCITMHIF